MLCSKKFILYLYNASFLFSYIFLYRRTSLFHDPSESYSMFVDLTQICIFSHHLTDIFYSFLYISPASRIDLNIKILITTLNFFINVTFLTLQNNIFFISMSFYHLWLFIICDYLIQLHNTAFTTKS